MTASHTPHAVIIGGSLGGLFAGTMLRHAGWSVDIYERSADDLNSRGGGVVLQPEVVEAFHRAGVDTQGMVLGVRSHHRVVYRRDGTVQSKQVAPQIQTSWSMIYTTLRDAFDGGYHQGRTLEHVVQNETAGTATFTDASTATGDLLIGADGNGSTVRRLLWPGVEPSYAGYLAWRGLVPENAMPAEAREGLHGDFGFANTAGSHVLGYLVPGEGGDTRPGHRLYNYVWYRVADAAQLAEIMTDREGRQRGFSMPEGKLAERWKDHLHAGAERLLPAPFRTVVQATEAPFAQAIRDLTVERMVKGLVVLLGDAAFVPRPHTAGSTSKAAANALALGDAQSGTGDIDAALAAWEPGQLALGRHLHERGTRIGTHLMFHGNPERMVG